MLERTWYVFNWHSAPPRLDPNRRASFYVMTNGNGHRPEKAYNERERMGTLFLALRDGVAKASTATKIPQRTIYSWFEAQGGLAEIRNFVDTQAAQALSTAEVAVCSELTRRLNLEQMSDNVVLEAFRVIAETKAKGVGPTAQAVNAVGVSTQAIVVNINE